MIQPISTRNICGRDNRYRPPTLKNFLRTPKICKFKDTIKDKFMTISIHVLQNNTICSFNSTSLYFVDWIDKSGSQGQGRKSLRHNSTEFNLFAHVPRQYHDYLSLGLFAEGPTGSSSALLQRLLHLHPSKWFLRKLRTNLAF